MRKSYVCFLDFHHPSLALDCSIWLEGIFFSKLFQSKVSSDGAKGKLNLPQKHSHAGMF